MARSGFRWSDDVPAFTTGVVSDLLEIPIWVLKQLDQDGVVRPRRRGKSRLYSKREMERLAQLWRLAQEEHLSVRTLKVIIKVVRGGIRDQI